MLEKQEFLKLDYFIDNEYLDKYIDLINENLKTKKVKFETNVHHIIPRHYFTHRNLDIDNSKNNKVNLYFGDHLLAHFYLSGCTTGRDKYWNFYSIYLLSGRTKDISYIENIKSLDDFNALYNNSIKSEYNHRKGTKVSEETIEKMRKAQQLRVQKYGRTNKDYIWINNGIKDYMIPQNELELYEKEGFIKGRLYRHSEETKNKISAKSKERIITNEFRHKMSEIAKKQVHSIEQRKAHSEWMKLNSRGEKNSFYGKHHTEEAKEKNRQAHIGRTWMTNGEELRSVKKEEVEDFLNAGYIKGKKFIKN